MDPCPFIRLTVSNLALKLPVAAKAARSAVHPSSSPCFCKIKLKHSHPQTVSVPHLSPESTDPVKWSSSSSYSSPAATFYLSKDDLDTLTGKKSILSAGRKKLALKISIYTGHADGVSCGVSAGGRLLGKVFVPLCLVGVELRPVVYHSGWICVGKGNAAAQFHVVVRSDPDPRFVFQFDGEPEVNPQVFQICGSVSQPVFTVNFSFRNTGGEHRNKKSFSRSLQSEHGSGKGWLSSFGSEREKSSGKERKGWSVTVHDLSGSPVAAASMVTPFVPSPGSDRVSRSNPGSWLILRPGDGTWKPWGRLEAWRERGGVASDGLGYKFELIPDMSASGVVLAESTLNAVKGGKFLIDLSGAGSKVGSSSSSTSSPVCSPGKKGSGDHGYGLWPYGAYRGFVMSARVEGQQRNGVSCKNKKGGKRGGGGGSKGTVVEVSVQQVTCTEDAAAYVALAAAVDLSVEACRLFSQRLRKELCHSRGDDQHHLLLAS